MPVVWPPMEPDLRTDTSPLAPARAVLNGLAAVALSALCSVALFALLTGAGLPRLVWGVVLLLSGVSVGAWLGWQAFTGELGEEADHGY